MPDLTITQETLSWLTLVILSAFASGYLLSLKDKSGDATAKQVSVTV